MPWVPSLGSSAEPGTRNAEPETLTMAQALNRALRKILTERPESLLLGQDIATYGGAFKVTEGLFKDFGRPRVLNTPLAESACTGYAIGLAVNGHRPIVEYQFADFSTEATTQITLNARRFTSAPAARCRWCCGCPAAAVLPSVHSTRRSSSRCTSRCPASSALPSTPQDAFNALLAAYEDDNPVLLFEHKGLYRRGKEPVAWTRTTARCGNRGRCVAAISPRL